MHGLSLDLVPGPSRVLHVRGEMDVANAEDFAAVLIEALSADSTLVLDMAEVTFIDAAGVRAILRVAACRNGEGPLRLVHAARVARLFKLVGLEGVTSIEFAPEGGEDVGSHHPGRRSAPAASQETRTESDESVPGNVARTA